MKAMRWTDSPLDPIEAYVGARTWRRWAYLGVFVFLVFVAVYWGFVAEVPTDYTDIRDHYKYGSIGSEPAAGIPYWVWQVLPEMFPQYLPEPERFQALPPAERTALAGYGQFGFVVEEGHDRPIGFSRRRVYLDRIGLNCAVCHTGVVKVTGGMDPNKIYGAGTTYNGGPNYSSPGQERVVILGMPSVTVNLSGYFQFLSNCAADGNFTTGNVMAYIDARTKLNPVEHFLYRQAVPSVREGLLTQRSQLKSILEEPSAGPGRVDTFNPYKLQKFGFPPDGTVGTADFPSIWNQRPREGMHLHWDGDNTSVFERNISASMGAGATPVSIDLPRMQRVARWLGAPDPHAVLSEADIQQARAQTTPRPGELPVPKYPFPIDAGLADKGKDVYARHCAVCHDWKGEKTGEVDPIDRIKTDPARLDSFTPELSFNQNTLGAGHWWRFNHFRKTNGYANMPLDGLWARAPYLHNGSVPTLEDLLNEKRPDHFFRGDDEYDPLKVGFRTDRDRTDDGRKLFWFDVKVKGNGNGGHEYGTGLPEDEKKQLLEYLKTL
jgi:hypothetical protein